MESAVFLYFVSIGAGLTFGVAIVAIPSVLIYQKMKARGNRDAVKTKQRASL